MDKNTMFVYDWCIFDLGDYYEQRTKRSNTLVYSNRRDVSNIYIFSNIYGEYIMEDFQITYQQLKDFLPNYPDWFERIEKYSLVYEVIRMFNSSYVKSFGEDYPLSSIDPYVVVEMLSDAMYEWDV